LFCLWLALAWLVFFRLVSVTGADVVLQEGWLSPTERASVSAISLRHIIWLPHESHAGMLLPSAVLRVEVFGYGKRV